MRKLMYGLAGISALALASAANATVTIGSPTTVTTVTTPNSNAGSTIVTFSYNDGHSSTPFEELVTFTNTLSGFYGLGVQSTATLDGNGVIVPETDVDFSRAFVSVACTAVGPACTALPAVFTNMSGEFANTNPGNDVNETRAVSGLFLPAGSYTIHILGTRGSVSSFDGNLNFAAGQLPEPATWAMMLLGFGAVGWQLRRRRNPLLTQAA